METTCSQQRLDVAGAESTKTLATSQLNSAEQLWQHAENYLCTRKGRSGLGLATAVHNSRQVFRLAPSTSVLLPETVCRVGLHKLSDQNYAPICVCIQL